MPRNNHDHPQLAAKGYVGYSLELAIALAVLSLVALPLTFCCIIWSLKEALEKEYGDVIVPSVVLFTRSCDVARIASIIIHFIVNLIGSVIVGISLYLQQLCASPTYQAIREEITSGSGDIQFGSPLPLAIRLFRRCRPLISLWLFLMLTSLVLHLSLNGAVGFQFNTLFLWGQVLRADGINPLLFELEHWTNITGTQCQTQLKQLSTNANLANITLVVDQSGSINWEDYTSIEEYWPNGTIYLNPNLVHIEYCFVNQVPEICSVTARWAPLTLFTAALLFKSIVVLISLTYVSHFHQPLYNSIGDILNLAVQRPEVAVVPANECLVDSSRARGVSRPDASLALTRALSRKIAWWRLMLTSDWICYAWQLFSLGAMIFAIYESTVAYFPLYSTRNIFTIFIGQGFGTPFRLLWTYTFGNDGIQLSSSQLTLLVFMANSVQVWVAISIFCANNHITRTWLETDWRGYYMRYRCPRVSSDTGRKGIGIRKPRVLQLPYLVTITQIGLGAVAHGLASQAFFVVETSGPRVTVYGAVENVLDFYVTHSPGVMAIGGLFVFILLTIMTIFMFVGRRTSMPVMNGSVRVVLASCTKLKGFPDDGIAWGDISEADDQKVAGFGGHVEPLDTGYYGKVNVVLR